MFEILNRIFGTPTIEHPFVVVAPVQKSAKKVVKEVKPDNIIYSSGRTFLRTETNDGFEDNLWTGSTGQRTAKLTSFDESMISDIKLKLKETKYNELKVFWAAEYTIDQVVRNFKGQRGYGQRTIEKYWSAMNKAFALYLENNNR